MNQTPPRITIVTPSFNQGKFLEETILSVIEQGYPNLEYIVMDGGSTDNSLDIIHKYEGHFAHWESNPDKGQADAINRGFHLSTGAILGWLNSDDLYLPGTLTYISNRISDLDEKKIVFGNCQLFDQERKFSEKSDVEKSQRNLDITLIDYIYQSSCFWTKKAWEVVGQLNPLLIYTLDWDWFIRAKKAGTKFEAVDELLSSYRLHSQHKSRTGRSIRTKEIAEIYRKYHSDTLADRYLKLRLNRMVEICEKLLRRSGFPGYKKIMRALFLQDLTEEQYDSIVGM